MSKNVGPEPSVPEGNAFLKVVWAQEDECEINTDQCIPTIGTKAPAAFEKIGTVLSLLDRMASCAWGCLQSDHVIEYLCGRVASSGRAALRLMKFGFYDEALVLCRGIGEIANLLCLFSYSKQGLTDWKASSRRDRLRDFSPARVRVRLEQLGTDPPISQERYSLLCERAAHVVPGTKPQAHNVLGVPLPGAILQVAGLLVCLNELAVALSLSTCFGTLLLGIRKDARTRILDASKDLAEQIGRATITEIDQYYSELLDEPGVRMQLERVADAIRKAQAAERQ